MGVHTTVRPAKASSIPSRFTLHRDMNLRTTIKRLRIPTNKRAILAGSSRFCIKMSTLTLEGTAPDWMAAATSGSMVDMVVNLG